MTVPPIASVQDGLHPRPQLLRRAYRLLDVEAGFAHDDEGIGVDAGWPTTPEAFDRVIRLPFPPESPASGIGDTGFHPTVWYRLPVTADDLAAAGLGTQGDRLMLRFGAVDHRADVWVDGQHAIGHVGGQTPFSVDVTALLADLPEGEDHSVVVRAHDDPLDVTVPRGKQDWHPEPHAIWYHRTTGIWRSVWLEAVPSVAVETLAWTTDVPGAMVRAEIELSARPDAPVDVEVELIHDGVTLARQTTRVTTDQIVVDLPLAGQRNGQHYEQLLWSVDDPRLVDARVRILTVPTGRRRSPHVLDEVDSYVGMRCVGVSRGAFLLNDRPIYLRSVLEQGYWPTSHLTAPSPGALRAEVELIKSLGFNAVRIHQKVEDPRFLYWCDRLGLMVWGETAGAYEFNARAVERLTKEWTDIVLRDRSHPSIVAWVPFNESWGVQHLAHDPAQRAYTLALVNLTRALDPTRPVVSNDGWEHTDSDLHTIHDYEHDGEVLRERYGSAEAVGEEMTTFGPAGRRMLLDGFHGEPLADRDQPVMLTEFGGVSFDSAGAYPDSWGYSAATDAADFEARLRAILDAVNASPVLSGFCYTQITDTRQETNGLCDEERRPKLPVETIAAIVRGGPSRG